MFRFKDTIGNLLFKKIFYGYILLMILISSYQIYAEYTSAQKYIEKELLSAEKSFSPILSKSVWHFDEAIIKSEAKAILSYGNIEGVAIVSPNDEVFILDGLISLDMKEYKKYIFKDQSLFKVKYSDNLLQRSFNLKDELISNEVLAKVTFFIDKNKVFEIVQESVSLILFNVILSAIILWMLFIYFANKILTEPLEDLIKATKELGEKTYNETEIKFNTHRHHELNTLTENFNIMSKQINEAFINMKQLTIIQNKQKKDLEEANKYKNDFLANMSHELKTPLNSINVISSVMMKNRKNELSPEHVKNLKVINNCGNDLLYLINDVLDISKLEAGEVTLNMQQIDLEALMYSIKDMFEPQVQQKKLNLIFEYDNSIGDIYSDEVRIKQIIKNLLSNAIKFVKDGTIKFLITHENDFVKVDVEDDGIGIPKDKLDHIFDRFKQADGSTTRKYGGTGLGLAICKELLDLLHGSISVESEVDVGTKFTVLIPKNSENVKVVLKEDKEETPIEEEKQKSNRALILNNDPLTFLPLVVELKKEFEVDQSSKIVDFFAYHKKNNYALVILDISGHKEENIIKVINSIKEPIVIVSSEETTTKIKELVKSFFIKPIDKELFIEKIRGIING